MPPGIYECRGAGDERTVYIRAESEAAARNAAVREGLNVRSVEQQFNATVPKGADLIDAVPKPRAGVDQLREAPVWTIAKGVFLGLLLWTVFAAAVALILRLFASVFG